MNTRTEDLLKIRDGEPIDAELRARILADPACVREIERLRHVQYALRELPDLEPPPDAWMRIEERMQEEARAGRHFAGSPWRWAAGAAIAASVAVLAVSMLGPSEDAPRVAGELPSTIVPEGGAQPVVSFPQVPVAYASLVEESARLERMLAQMPRRRQVMSADVASTIVGLEDRIAWVDEQLSMAAARDMDPPHRQALWNERVNVMNALLHVHYAQQAGY